MATLLVVVLIAVVVAAAVNAAMSVTRSTNADYFGTRAFYAAEAGAEHALAQVELALQDGFLSPDELAGIEPPALEGFEFTEFEVIKEGTWDTASIKDGPFAGLYAITQNIRVTSRATDVTGAHAGIVLGAQAQAIPMFQFAAFGNGAMEAYTGSRSDTWGRAHVNGDIYMATSDHHIHTVITTPGRFIRDGRVSHKDLSEIDVFVELQNGSEVEVEFDSEDTPDPEAFKNRSELELDGRLRTGAMGVDSLTLPLPDSMGPHELIGPRRITDDLAGQATKFSWRADMYVTVDLGSVRDQDDVCDDPPSTGSDLWANITVERPFGGAVPDDEDKCEIIQIRWETFFDTAELKWVDAVDVDIGELRDWVSENPSQNATQIIYVEIKNSTTLTDPSETDNSGDGYYFPILRIKNGARLPGPLTIGSEYPLYMQGDYNDVNKQPAAVFGDRLTVLSNEWKDSENRVTYVPFRGADPTTQYFAIVTGEGEGYLGCYHHGPDPNCTPITNGCSPGITVQMLEDWRACGGKCLHRMIGSFITFWYPQIASPYGDCPNPNPSYKSPQRDWSFDPDLMDPANLPPGTPNVGYVLRASFREVY